MSTDSGSAVVCTGSVFAGESRIRFLFQPIDTEIREYLAASESPSSEELDALATSLLERYDENLELLIDELASADDLPDPTVQERDFQVHSRQRAHPSGLAGTERAPRRD